MKNEDSITSVKNDNFSYSKNSFEEPNQHCQSNFSTHVELYNLENPMIQYRKSQKNSNKERYETETEFINKPKESTELRNYEKIFIKKNMQKHQSRRLPHIVIYFVMFVTGIVYRIEGKSEKNKVKITPIVKLSAIVSSICYIITISAGLIFSVSTIWFLIADSLNESTKTTIFSRSVTIILSLIWLSLGSYSIKVLHNLYITKDLQDAMRLKTKSFFKIPASLIVLALIGIFLYSILSSIQLNLNECQQIKLSLVICYLKYYSTIVYSIITIFWNYLVALTIMIINRTYAISIRKYLIDLEIDSFNIMEISQNLMSKKTQTTNIDNFDYKSNESTEIGEIDLDDDDEEENIIIKNLKHNSSMVNKENQVTCNVCSARFLKTPNDPRNLSCKHIKSPNDILCEYWMLANKLKLFSILTQRWMFSLIFSILMWCLSSLIGWIGAKNPSLVSVLEFLVPLLILGVIFGTYAETNAEGNKIIRVVHPLEERMRLLTYLKQNPLQVRMFNFRLDYSLEVKFMSAISTGFLIQIIYHELNP